MLSNSVLLVVSIHSTPEPEYMASVLRALGSPLKNISLFFNLIPGVPDISKARNKLASDFLKTEYEYLLMTDCDMGFMPMDIERLVGRGVQLIGGLYRHKVPMPSYVLNSIVDGFNPADGVLQEVKYVGTGFMLIHRSVLESMVLAYPEIQYNPDANENPGQQYGFFDSMIFEGRRLSCDWAFCQRWRNLEGRVFVDCARLIPHYGKACFA